MLLPVKSALVVVISQGLDYRKINQCYTVLCHTCCVRLCCAVLSAVQYCAVQCQLCMLCCAALFILLHCLMLY